MYFYMPTKVYEEVNCIENHLSDISEFGRVALVVTGSKSSKLNGSLSAVEKVLKKSDISYEIFDEIEENPSVETVMKAAKVGINIGAEFVIGVGGGSPLDASKAIAILIGEKNTEAAILFDMKKNVNAVDVIAVPTTCGTGSEVTGVSVLTVHDKRTKMSLPHRIFPKLALVDYSYLKSADRRVICNTAIDAMSHLVESYLVKESTSYTEMIVEAGLRTWGRCVDALWGNRDFDDKDYERLMHAATLGGMSIAHTGTAIPHSLSYSITYELHVPHGVAVGYFLPGYIYGAGDEVCGRLLSLMGFTSIEEFAGFYQDVTGIGILPEKNLEYVVDCVSKNRAKLSLCRYELDRDKLMNIAMWKYPK